MAKEQTDRTTLDLFIDERRPGRPKTNPFSRDEQLRINKRNQLRRDKVRGLRRVELKINAQAVNALNELAFQHALSRSELIEQILLAELARHRGRRRQRRLIPGAPALRRGWTRTAPVINLRRNEFLPQ